MSKKRMNTVGTILDTSGSAPKGKTGSGFARNAPRDPQAKTKEGQKTLDQLNEAIEKAKNSKVGQAVSRAADKAEKLLAKGDIEALKKLSVHLDGMFDKAAASSGGHPAAAAGLALAYAIKEVFLPTNVIDIVPVGKIVTKGKKAVKALRKTEKAADGIKAVEKGANAGKKGAKGGHVRGKAKLKCGEYGKYGDLKKKSAGGKFDRDHIPSKASLKKQAENLKGGPLSNKEKKAIDNAADAVAIPRQAHIDVSPTYGQSAAEAAKDANNLAGAAKRDVEEMLKKIDDYDADGGCKKAYKKAAKTVLRKSNADYDKWLAGILKDVNKK